MRKRIISLKAFISTVRASAATACRTSPPRRNRRPHSLLRRSSLHRQGRTSAERPRHALSQSARKQQFLQSLRVTPEITLRLGRSAWQAGQWQLDANRLGELMAGEISVNDIQAGDIYPDIRQKGVDMLLGLDIAALAYKHQTDRLVIVANDADYVPAVKLAREEGIKVVLDPLWTRAAEDLREHVDYVCNKLPRPQHSNYPHGIHIFDDPKNTTPAPTRNSTKALKGKNRNTAACPDDGQAVLLTSRRSICAVFSAS